MWWIITLRNVCLPRTSTQSRRIMHTCTITSQWVRQGHLKNRMGPWRAYRMGSEYGCISLALLDWTLKHSFCSMRRSNQARRENALYAAAGERTEVRTAGTSYFNGHKPTPMGYRQQPLEMKSRVSRCYALRAGFSLETEHQKRIQFRHVTTALGLPSGITCALNKYVNSTVRNKTRNRCSVNAPDDNTIHPGALKTSSEIDLTGT